MFLRQTQAIFTKTLQKSHITIFYVDFVR